MTLKLALDTLETYSSTDTRLDALEAGIAYGPAGGDLTGTYPNPTIKTNVALAGVPTASTASPTTSTTQLATTAFVTTADTALDTRLLTLETVAANTRTASYTLVLTDANKVVEMNLGTATILTVPPNSTVAFPIGTIVEVTRLGVGTVTITPFAGVSIRSADSLLSLRAQYSTVSLRKRATDEWVLVGDVA